MSKVRIKSYTRRSKKGKPVRVRQYARRAGRKGVHLPKNVSAGDELQKKLIEKKEQTSLTPEEIALRKEVTEGFKRASANRQILGMSPEQYSRYLLHKEKTKPKTPKSQPTQNKQVASSKGVTPKKGLFEKTEDKLAKFVEKYSGRKYKRQL